MSAPNPPKPITAIRFGYPFKTKQDKEITDPQAFYEGLANVQGGHYLLSPHGFFHGGIHVAWASSNAFQVEQGARCLADGEVVAYRINRRYNDATPGTAGDGPVLRPYSTGFVLVRHRLQAPTPPQAPKPAPMGNPGADIRNWGTWLCEDPQGRKHLAWLRHGTSLTVEVGAINPGDSGYVPVLATSGFGIPDQGWIKRNCLAIDPLAGTSIRSKMGFKDVVATQVYRGDSVDPEATAAHAQNKAEREHPATPPAPTLTLYSLYMHLADFESYGEHPAWKRPGYWPAKRYRVGKKANDTIGKEKSGRQWVKRFPSSSSIADLVSPFREYVSNFTSALESAGITVRINTTFRPPQRSYLMYYARQVATGTMAPDKVPDFAPQGEDEPVSIDWAHLDEAGKSDHKAAVAAAKAMDLAYGAAGAIGRPYASNHNHGKAIDMAFVPEWGGGKKVKSANGTFVDISGKRDLMDVGATYSVFHWNYAGPKKKHDEPHWSVDGS